MEPRYQEVKDHLLHLVKLSPVATAIASNADQSVILLNHKFTELFGYTTDDVGTMPEWWQLAFPDPEYRSRVTCQWQALATNGSGNVQNRAPLEMRITCKDGTTKYVEFDYTSVGDIYKVTFIDLTHHKQVESESLQALSLLEATLDSTTDGILVVDLNGNMLQCNSNFAKIWGISDEVVVSKDEQKSIAHALSQVADPEQFLARVQHLYAEPEMEDFCHVHLKDGRILERYTRPQKVDGVTVGRVWSFRDITSAKRAEEALRYSENILSTAINALNDWIHVIDSDMRLVLANEAFRSMMRSLGYKGDLIGTDIHEVFPFLDKKVFDEYRTVLKTGTQVSTDEVVQLGGKTYYAETTKTPVFEDGRVVRVITTIRNVTERKLSEQALRESERKYRQLFENMIAGFALHEMIYDQNGEPADYRYLEVNPAFEKLTGIPASALVGRTVKEVMPETEQYWIETYGKVAETGQPIAYQNYSRELGKYYDTWSFSPAKGQFAVVFTDITERRQAQAELAQAKAQAEQRAAEMESFVSNIADGVALFDARGDLVFVNENGRRLLGAADTEPLEAWRTRFTFYGIDGKALAAEQLPIAKALGGGVTRDLRLRAVTAWGKEVLVSVSAAPVRDATGLVTGVAVVFRDQTERIELERVKEDLYEREHHISEVLQKALLPQELPKMAGCQIAVLYEPALREAEVGGDFYDAFDLGQGRLAVVIGDVTGKGLAAAARVAAARHTIRSCSHIDAWPSSVMTMANEVLCRSLNKEEESVLTALFAVIDTQRGTITFANGGHEPAVIRRASGEVVEIEVPGRVLGVQGGFTYPEVQWELQPGDTVLMVTDGITEARNNSGDLFGIDGITNYLRVSPGISLDEMVHELPEAARKFAHGPLRDDAAVIALRLDN